MIHDDVESVWNGVGRWDPSYFVTPLALPSSGRMRGYFTLTLAALLARCAAGLSINRRKALSTTIAVPILAATDASAISTEPLIPGMTAAISSGARYNPQVVGDDWIMPPLATSLAQARLGAKELSPLSQPLWDTTNELYYAPWLFGTWKVTATLRRKTFPYTTNFLVSRSLEEGSPRNRVEAVGNQCQYTQHYFSTLANTLSNQLTVQLGTGIPSSKIIQDRAFNTISISKAYQQLTPVQEVQWDYRNDPTSLKLAFDANPLGPDMRPLGPRRAQVFIQARRAEALGDDVYATAEQSRTLTLAVRDGIASDTESITEFRKLSDNHVTAINRIAVYLTPNPNSREGILWQQTGGKAVAFYDYELDLRRETETFATADGSTEERACVVTPKDVPQCA